MSNVYNNKSKIFRNLYNYIPFIENDNIKIEMVNRNLNYLKEFVFELL